MMTQKKTGVKTSNWYETKVKLDFEQEDGTVKKVQQLYVVEADSFMEAEEAITDESFGYTSGEYEVTAVKKASYHEVFFSDAVNDNTWYRVKVEFWYRPEKGKMKKSSETFLVQSNSVSEAECYADAVLSGSMQGYEIKDVVTTEILDVFKRPAPGASKE